MVDIADEDALESAPDSLKPFVGWRLVVRRLLGVDLYEEPQVDPPVDPVTPCA